MPGSATRGPRGTTWMSMALAAAGIAAVARDVVATQPERRASTTVADIVVCLATAGTLSWVTAGILLPAVLDA